jgi:hypothetical protein
MGGGLGATSLGCSTRVVIMKSNIKENKKHRIIGIRHTLKKLKDNGLVEDGTNYPDIAVSNIKDELSRKSIKWYQIGYKRGAKEVLDRLLNQKILVKYDKNGDLFLETKLKKITWTKKLKIKTGKAIRTLPAQKFKIEIRDLDFK